MKTIKYVGKHPASIQLMNKFVVDVMPGKEITIPDRDVECLKRINKDTNEWEIKEEENA